jgi:hypothetical protein
MSSAGAAHRAAISVSNARAEASRRNGAKSLGPRTPEGKAHSAQNALKHGLRAEKHVVLPDEDAVEFAALEAALLAELAPQGMLQSILVRRIARAAWRLDRADRMEAEVLEERRYSDAGLGLALIRDGNGTRSFDTLLRYRGAAVAEFMRSLRMLKALQAEAPVPVEQTAGAARALEARAGRAAAPAPIARPGPNKPERRLAGGNVTSDQPSPAAPSTSSRRAGRQTNLSLVGIGTKAAVPCPPRESALPSRPHEPENSLESAAEPRSGGGRRDHSKPALRRPLA